MDQPFDPGGLPGGPDLPGSGMPGPGLFVGIFVVLAVGVLVAGVLAAKRRREQLEQRAAWAAERGWRFESDAPSLVDAWAGEPFGRGLRRRAQGHVTGTYRGVPFSAFEYRYETESTSTDSEGRTSTTRHVHRFDVAVLRLGARLPDLELAPETAFSRVVDAVTGRDIALEWERFNRSYRLTCADRKLAMDLFSPRTMEHLLTHGPVRLRITRGDALVWRPTRAETVVPWGPGDPAVPLESSSAPLDVALTLLRGVPDFVWQDRGGLPPALAGARW